MTYALLAVALLVAAGLPLAALLEPSLGIRARLGVAFMLGAGFVTLLLLVATFTGLPWSRTVALAPIAFVAAIAFAMARRKVTTAAPRAAAQPLVIAIDFATMLSVAGYALFAVVAKPWEWDFWAIWGLKAKEFLLMRGVNFVYLSRPDNFFSHPDYPPLLPLLYDFVALVEGAWNDRWLGVIAVAFSVAMLLVLREELERQTGSPLIGALGTLALSGAACSPWVGLGEGPLVALSVAGLVILSRGLRDDAPRAIVTGSVLLGLSALTKNEGVSLSIAMALAALLVSRRRLLHVVLPAALVTSPWIVARLVTATTTDVFEGGFLARASERLSDPGAFLATLAGGHFERAEFWAILAAIVVLSPATAKRERFLLVTIGLQALAYVAVYAGTLNDLASHVQGSLGRVTSHLAPLAGVVCVAGIAALLRSSPRPASEREETNEQQA
jgi:hypothetical protein